MTETQPNLPAIRPADRVPAVSDVDSWIGVVGEVAKFAGYIADTEFVPRSLRGNPAAATAAVMYGREVGLPPMTSLTQTHVIEGRPSLSAAAKRAQVIAQGHEIEVLESTGAICRMRARRRGSERWTEEVVWTLDMARAASLLGKSNWKNSPRRMLQARASGELCDLYFPDVVMGFTTTEEELDGGGEEGDAPPPSQGTSRVARKRAAPPAKKAAAALPAGGGSKAPPAPRPAAAEGPPLPGEDGYDALAPAADEQVSAGGPGDGSSSSPGGEDEPGEDGEGSPADTEQPAETTEQPVEERPAKSRKASRPQMRMLMAVLSEREVPEERRHEVASSLLGRFVESFTELTSADVRHLIDTISRTRDGAQLRALVEHGVDPAEPEPVPADQDSKDES